MTGFSNYSNAQNYNNNFNGSYYNPNMGNTNVSRMMREENLRMGNMNAHQGNGIRFFNLLTFSEEKIKKYNKMYLNTY